MKNDKVKDEKPPIAYTKDGTKVHGVWIDPKILVMMMDDGLAVTDVLLLAIITNLESSKKGKGCYASNAVLGKWTKRSIPRTSEAITRFKKLKLVEQTAFNGRRRTLKTTYKKEPKETTTPAATLSNRQRGMPYKDKGKVTTLSEPTVSDGEYGFGMVKTSKEPSTEFDIAIATKLLESSKKHLGTSHRNVRRARLKTWAKHITYLRTIDKVSESRIKKVMDWYVKNMGGEFIPEVYAAESFRKKYDRIEKAFNRDLGSGSVEITPEAETIVRRLSRLGWPKGATEAVPAAVQACLTAYTAWLVERDVFIKRLRENDLKDDYGGEQKRLLKFGEYITRTMPSPAHFVQEWMEGIHQRVSGWDEWNGRFDPYIFKRHTTQFRNMGRGWAENFANDPDRWDRFIEVMKLENK